MNIIEELLKPSIIEIHGPAGSGKTNLCIHIANILLPLGKEIYFINADKGLSVERIYNVVKDEEKMKRIHLKYVKTEKELKKSIQDANDVLIIDPITYFYRLSKDIKELEEVFKDIKKKNIPCIVTNQVYDNIDTGTTTPLAYPLIEKYCDVIISLEKEHYITKLKITKPIRKVLFFEIEKDGIKFLSI